MKYLYILFLINFSAFAQFEKDSLEIIDADLGNWPMRKTTKMDLIDKAPLPGYKYLLVVGLKYKITKNKPSLDSAMMANFGKARIELLQKNETDWHGIFVGAETMFEFESNYFYLKNKIDKKQLKQELKQYFKSKYTNLELCCLELKEDSKWKQYITHIYPQDRFLFFKNNQIAINNMKASGSDLSKIRKIYYVSDFVSKLNVKFFIEESITQKFFYEKTVKENNHYSVYIWQEQVLKLEDINTTTNTIYRMSKTHKGKYKGWRTLEN